MLKAIFTAGLLANAAAASADVIARDADASAVLAEYIAREQPAFAWRELERRAMGGGAMLHRLELTSQTWMGSDWKHALNILTPPGDAGQGDAARPGHCVLVITAGDEEIHAQVCSMLCLRMGVPIAVLHQVPNQPLLRDRSGNGRGLWEDALIAQTFLEFSQSGDADWPLLLPMVRSVVSAMDALGAYAQQRSDEDAAGWTFGRLEKFLTTGASKRGWTTWLSAAADERVFAIAPMVYDNLNLTRQIPLHFETWGEPSPSIHDYTERGLLEMLREARGRQLIQIIDPFSYLDRITVPKLLLLGTNDPYWPLGAIHEYYELLNGDTWCHYVPNAGHSLGANVGVLFAIAGFFDAVTGRTPTLPAFSLSVSDDGALATVRFAAPAEGDEPCTPREVNLLATAAEQGMDFRRSNWQRAAMQQIDAASWTIEIPSQFAGRSAATAFIGEIALVDHSDRTFLIHTPVTIQRIDQ